VLPVRVAVSAADPITGRGVISCLTGRPDVEVVPNSRPPAADVLVFAADPVTAESLTALRALTRDRPLPVVLLTTELAEGDLVTAVDCRVVAVLPRGSTTPEALADAVLAAAGGGGVLPPDLLGTLLAQVRRLRAEAAASGALAPREAQVIRLLADGLDTAQIAEVLSYSERTVKNVLYGVLNRLNLRNRPHAVAYALRNGLI
jgi:DNA-binding NarL/FixJ family response regulator